MSVKCQYVFECMKEDGILQPNLDHAGRLKGNCGTWLQKYGILKKDRLTFSGVARSLGSMNAAFSSATQASRSEMVRGRVYGWRLVALTCCPSGTITNCLWRSAVGEDCSEEVGDGERSVMTEFGLSVMVICSPVSSFKLRSRGIVISAEGVVRGDY